MRKCLFGKFEVYLTSGPIEPSPDSDWRSDGPAEIGRIFSVCVAALQDSFVDVDVTGNPQFCEPVLFISSCCFATCIYFKTIKPHNYHLNFLYDVCTLKKCEFHIFYMSKTVYIFFMLI